MFKRGSRLLFVVGLLILVGACQIPLPGPAGPGDQKAAEQALAAYLSGEFIDDEQPHYVTWVAAPIGDELRPLEALDVRGAYK
ncbi:MAG: hypothetical protein KJ734_05710, partial [Chloroflexi bacterium]|nr:hypothetical protein [Chloroflexota bacterium]